MNIKQMIYLKVSFRKINKIILTILFFIVFLISDLIAKENKILIKVDNEIITSIDLLNEIKYLSIINDQFKSAEQKLQIQLAKNSLIKEKIKIVELLKYKQNLEINQNLLENIIIKTFSGLNINTIEDFEYYFREQSLEANFIKKKITIETLWNQLIYSKFYKNVKINEKEIKESISIIKKQKEYFLSELMITADNTKELKTKIQSVKKKIKEKSFSQAALIYSSSETSKKGGKLGWIKESALNNKIKNELNLINIGHTTKPIVVPGGFLILKIEDIRKVEKKINLNDEIKIIVEKKTNEQLNRMSIVYFNKIKKNVQINEI